MENEPQKWTWICGVLNSTRYDIIPGVHLKDIEQIHECKTNVADAILHLLYIIVASLVLISKRYYGFNKLPSPYLVRWPGHTTRWISISLLLLCALASVGEGILTQIGRKEAGDIQLQFYLPVCLMFIATVVSLIYYQLAEIWRAPRLCWLLLVYWLCCLGLKSTQIIWLYERNVDVEAAILWITVSMIVLYFTISLLELNLIASKVCKVRGQHCIGRKVECDDMRYTDDYVSFLYYITFWWMNWLFKMGFRHPLEIKDLGSLPDNHRSQHLYQVFKEDFQKELVYKASIGQKPSVWKVFGRVYKKEILYAGLTRLVYELACLIGPLTLNGIVAYAFVYGKPSEKDARLYVTLQDFFANGYVLLVVMFVANIIQYFSFHQNLYLSNLIGVHIKTSIQTMVYDKSLRLSSYVISGGNMTVGQITNHMSVDAFNMFFFSQKMHHLWAVPFRLISVACLLYLQVELATFLALATLLIAIPTELITARVQARKQKTVMGLADDRLKRSNEMLHGIKLIKLYGWEEMFCKAIEKVRKMEMLDVFKYNGCYAANVAVVLCTPILMNLAVFASYPYLTGKPLEPNTTFAALSLMNLLTEPIFFVPLVTSLLVNAFVAVRRLQTFFLAPEIERSHEFEWREHLIERKKETFSHCVKPFDDTQDEKSPLLRSRSTTSDYESIFYRMSQEAGRPSERINDHFAIKIENGNFTWDNESSVPILKDINMEIPHGELTMVVGPVGSGKSSLLSAILGEMTTLSGSVVFGAITNGNDGCSSGVAYGAQKAWLMNTSLRDNVLFGQPYKKGRYHKIVGACALKPDIDILPAGDLTEIGEKGINLSGGQKQRVSVARTMYSNKSVVLLDDPLSALDVNVGGHLFRKGILGRLRKANRTVVVVTHQLQYLQLAEKVIVMKEGRIAFQGTFDDMASEEPELYKNWQKDVIACSESELSGLSGEESTVEERKTLKKAVSRIGIETGKGKLIQKEELARGSVVADVYWYYIRNMGLFWAVVFSFGRMILEAFNISRNFVLSDWSEAGLTNKTVNEINRDFVGTYTGLVFACCALVAVHALSLLIATWNAAKALYLRMLRNIIRTPNRFFDTTPIGRILNRFSSDTQIIDTRLILTFSTLINFFWVFVFAIFVNIVITPIVLIEVIPIIVVYVVIAVYFIRSSRELQRLDSVTRSPVFAHFSETLGGLPTIRAYREQKRFFNKLLVCLDTNIVAFMYLQAAYSWLGLQLSMCGGFVVLMVGLTTLLQATVLGSLESSSVGLALSYVLMISVQLYNLVRAAADTEMQMNPVERVMYYASVPNENYDGSEPPLDWPRRGEIKIDNISVRYADTLPAVIQDVSLHVESGEKVGICGRTGSGKSSLTLALLRIIQTYKGQIVIDGEDIARLPLTTLRQRLSIIPQDPILFTGSIRSNLDPNGTKSDDELWHALEIAQLKTLISDSALGLDTLITEGGENFSVGQRQLFCLARAFLRNSRVLIMDEATASIDYDTEKLLKTVVATAFKDKTVLTIAHRVSTILESDTIWVLQNGEVVECDSPENLLAMETSEFYSMVQANK